MYGNEVIRLYDVGVAGLHRLLARLDTIMCTSVIIAIAGMEEALASFDRRILLELRESEK